jgi:hypothetical protein
MTDHDRDLRSAFRRLELPPAPASLRARLAGIAAPPPRVQPRLWRPPAVVVPAALVVLVLVGLAVATGGLRPPTPTPGASPSAPPASTPSATAALSTLCIPWPPYKGVFIPTLTCEAAVKAALGGLPTGHPPITGITVQLGRYCPTDAPCLSDLNLITGYVTITFEGAPAVLVTVRDEPNSPVVVTRIEPLPTPGPSEITSPAPLPNPGGTCSASQIVLGATTYGYGYGSLGTTVVFVTQPLWNVGGDCVRQLPAVIGVAPPTGPFGSVTVIDAGTTTLSGVNSPAMSARIRSGESLSIVLGDSWWGDANGNPLGSAPPCAGAIRDVTRVEFPFASGTTQIDLPTTWREVCSSPASVTLRLQTK